MSSYPYPPTHAFNVPSNYLQQWPYPPPSSAAPANQPDTFDRGHSFHSHQTQNNPATPVEYNEVHNFQANPRIPGLNAHGSPTPFPPPPFPYMSHPSPSQHPQTSFPVQMPPLAYPPMPTPGPYPMRQSSADGTGFNLGSSSAFASQASTTFGPRQDGDREDGEVTDREGGRPQSRGADFAAGAYSSRSYDGQNSLGMGLHAPEDATATGFGSRDSQQFKANTSEAPARTMPDIEEGEASSMSSSSTRDSGSRTTPEL